MFLLCAWLHLRPTGVFLGTGRRGTRRPKQTAGSLLHQAGFGMQLTPQQRTTMDTCKLPEWIVCAWSFACSICSCSCRASGYALLGHGTLQDAALATTVPTAFVLSFSSYFFLAAASGVVHAHVRRHRIVQRKTQKRCVGLRTIQL